jgi:hypothetical protein
MEIRIAHLYPSLMNIYADRGNIITLARRCAWRGIDMSVDEFSPGQSLDWEAYDFFYLGGGQDREQLLVCRDLSARGEGLVSAIEGGAALLSICGGYQLLGEYYRTAAGETMEGVGLFKAHTVAGDRRCIGNVVVEADLNGQSMTLVGFENHSGKTYLDPGQQPLGRVVFGFGNNAEDGTEGIVYRNAVGTYMHGPLLPKNPQFTDWLLEKSLQHRYAGEGGRELPQLAHLDDRMEEAAHRVAVKAARK